MKEGVSRFFKRCDIDERDKGPMAVKFAVSFGEYVNGCQIVFAELVGQCAERPT